LGILGGAQGVGGGYVTPEVRHQLTKTVHCFQYGVPPNQLPPDVRCQNPALVTSPDFAALDTGRQRIARNLARHLDDRPREGDCHHIGKTVNDPYGFALKSEVALPADLQLTAVTGYDRYNRKIDLDLDFSPETLFEVNTQDNGWQLYQDLKLEGETSLIADN